MNNDILLLDRIRNDLMIKEVTWNEKKMFGGVFFMVDDKMLAGTFRGGLMCRVHPDETEKLLKIEGTEQMMQKQRVMKGYILVSVETLESDEQLSFWLDSCLVYNPIAKASKKKNKKG